MCAFNLQRMVKLVFISPALFSGFVLFARRQFGAIPLRMRITTRKFTIFYAVISPDKQNRSL